MATLSKSEDLVKLGSLSEGDRFLHRSSFDSAAAEWIFVENRYDGRVSFFRGEEDDGLFWQLPSTALVVPVRKET